MKSTFRVLILVSTFLLPTLAMAHGDAAHVMGTVISTEADHVVVTTTKGKKVSLAFQPQTIFQQNGIHSKDARPKIGDRLVAEVTKDGLPQDRDWVATEINFATPKTKP